MSVTSVAFTPDGHHVVTADVDGTVRLWAPGSARPSRVLAELPEPVHAVAVSPDGRHALCGTGSWNWSSLTTRTAGLRLPDLATGHRLRTLGTDRKRVATVAFTPDGRHALSGSEDGALRLWELRTGDCLLTLTGHRKEITSLRLSPDARYAVSGSSDWTVRHWDLHTGDCLRVIPGHRPGVTGVCLDTGGRHLVSSGEDSRVQLWNLRTGHARDLPGPTTNVQSVDLTSDGRFVVAGDKTPHRMGMGTGLVTRGAAAAATARRDQAHASAVPRPAHSAGPPNCRRTAP